MRPPVIRLRSSLLFLVWELRWFFNRFDFSRSGGHFSGLKLFFFLLKLFFFLLCRPVPLFASIAQLIFHENLSSIRATDGFRHFFMPKSHLR